MNLCTERKREIFVNLFDCRLDAFNAGNKFSSLFDALFVCLNVFGDDCKQLVTGVNQFFSHETSVFIGVVFYLHPVRIDAKFAVGPILAVIHLDYVVVGCIVPVCVEVNTDAVCIAFEGLCNGGCETAVENFAVKLCGRGSYRLDCRNLNLFVSIDAIFEA